MDIKRLRFEINNNGDFTEEEFIKLEEGYRNLFIKIYGADAVDAFICVTKMNIIADDFRKNKVKDFLKNYDKTLDVIESVKNDDNIELLCIYDENDKLIGGGRLRKINENEASIPDIAFCDLGEKEMREVWKEAIVFAEKYFVDKGFKTMYVEIPLKDAPLLIRADSLGFKEDPKDILVSDRHITYLLNKKLVRSKNE